MRIINSRDIMETIEMLTAENLDVRTVTMGISLLDCIDPDADKACEKIYNKITRLAGNLVSVVDGKGRGGQLHRRLRCAGTQGLFRGR